MRALQASELNSIDDYAYVDAPKPAPGPGEALIKVCACGVGYVDALVSLGRYQVKPALPHIPGAEVGGVIAEIGEGVTGLARGDRVMAAVRGGFAEYALAPASAVSLIPPAMSFQQAAGFRVNYLTALHGLRGRAELQAGERLLVLGAAGGVGAAAVQIGKRLGAHVIGAASTEAKRAFASSAGADATVDAAPEGWRDRLKVVTGGKGLDVAFDPTCGPLFELVFRSMAWGGRHLVVGFAGGPIPALSANLTLMKGAALMGVDVRQFMLLEPETADLYLRELLGWVADGSLVPPLGRTFSFHEGREALAFALSGKGIGKTVLNVS